MFKVNNKHTRMTSIDLAAMSILQIYTHFTTFLVFVPLTLNMKLLAGQLSSFVKICLGWIKFGRKKTPFFRCHIFRIGFKEDSFI